MSEIYNVRVIKKISIDNKVFCEGDIIRGYFELFNNVIYFVSDTFRIGLDYIDSVNMVNHSIAPQVILILLIGSFFLGLTVFLKSGLIGLILLYSLSCFSTVLILTFLPKCAG